MKRVTFDNLLKAVNDAYNLKEVAERLRTSTAGVSALFCLLGKGREELANLDKKSETKIRERFLDNNLFDYLLKRRDLRALNKEDKKRLLNFNVSTLAAIFSCDFDKFKQELEDKGVNPKDMYGGRLSPEDYLEAQQFIERVRSLRGIRPISHQDRNSQQSYSPIHPSTNLSQPPFTELFIDQLDTLENKLAFLLSRLLEIDLNDYDSLNYWLEDVSKIVQTIMARNSNKADALRDIRATLSISHVPNTYTQQLLSKIASNLNNPQLNILCNGYNYHSHQNYSSNLPYSETTSVLSMRQANLEGAIDLEKMTERAPKARRVNSFFVTPLEDNLLHTKLEEFADRFFTIDFTEENSVDNLSIWLNDLETYLQSFEILEGKLEIETLAQALPVSFNEPEIRSQFLALNSINGPYFNLLIKAIKSKYPDSTYFSPRG
ncbi:hypothetical protein [Legionella gresilensis]|uniref:hypothetical protein n=1 Tax=Legionella gresilensis TaxID=91823 RepID=UPI001041736B|nr:hypothetical protein [Legionella gresilensis]